MVGMKIEDIEKMILVRQSYVDGLRSLRPRDDNEALQDELAWQQRSLQMARSQKARLLIPVQRQAQLLQRVRWAEGEVRKIEAQFVQASMGAKSANECEASVKSKLEKAKQAGPCVIARASAARSLSQNPPVKSILGTWISAPCCACWSRSSFGSPGMSLWLQRFLGSFSGGQWALLWALLLCNPVVQCSLFLWFLQWLLLNRQWPLKFLMWVRSILLRWAPLLLEASLNGNRTLGGPL